MTGDTMKSGVIETDHEKLDLRHPHRRKMAKSLHILNGSGDIAVNMMRQVNLAAAYHDHISCTKSADLCNKISEVKESRANMPFETDHIYANCSEARLAKIYNLVAVTPSRDERRQLQDMCLLHLQLIKHLKEQNEKKERQIRILRQENKMLKVQNVEARKRRRQNRQNRNKHAYKGSPSNANLPNLPAVPQASRSIIESSRQITPANRLVTRYFGRRSRTIPLRALKRRCWGPPKDLVSKKSVINSSVASVSSVSESQGGKSPNFKDDSETEHVSSAESYGSSAASSMQQNIETTEQEYHVLSVFSIQYDLNNTKPIEVPSFKLRQLPSCYQMEGTEDLDDKVFAHRHAKFEQAEKRRKRWDIQRLRNAEMGNKSGLKGGPRTKNKKRCEKIFEFDPNEIQEIEVCDSLPVVTFGQAIPVIPRREFRLPRSVRACYSKDEEEEEDDDDEEETTQIDD